MKNLILLPFLFLAPFLNAQVNENNCNISLLKVKGEATTSVLPDLAIANIPVTAINTDYNKTLADLNTKVDRVVKSLIALGYNKDSIETQHFNISKNTVYRKGYSKDSGYIARQSLIVKFPYDQKKVLAIINEISTSGADPNLSFMFTLSPAKTKEVKNILIKQAINNAKEKATLIASASGVTLTGIRNISYGIDQAVSYPPMYAESRMMNQGDDKSQMEFGGFNVSKMTVSDNLYISWEIK